MEHTKLKTERMKKKTDVIYERRRFQLFLIINSTIMTNRLLRFKSPECVIWQLMVRLQEPNTCSQPSPCRDVEPIP